MTKSNGKDLTLFSLVSLRTNTATITDNAHAPRSTAADKTHKVAITRLGNRIRAGGTAELSGYKLWLNIGHGTLGWTMACGSARLIADLVSSRRPNIRDEDLALARCDA